MTFFLLYPYTISYHIWLDYIETHYLQLFKVIANNFNLSIVIDPRTSLKSGSLFLVMVSVRSFVRKYVRKKHTDHWVKPFFKIGLWLVLGRGSLYDSSLDFFLLFSYDIWRSELWTSNFLSAGFHHWHQTQLGEETTRNDSGDIFQYSSAQSQSNFRTRKYQWQQQSNDNGR